MGSKPPVHLPTKIAKNTAREKEEETEKQMGSNRKSGGADKGKRKQEITKQTQREKMDVRCGDQRAGTTKRLSVSRQSHRGHPLKGNTSFDLKYYDSSMFLKLF